MSIWNRLAGGPQRTADSACRAQLVAADRVAVRDANYWTTNQTAT